METEELKILLTLEPTWTVSLNGTGLETIRSSDISFDGKGIFLGKWSRRIDSIDWLRQTSSDQKTARQARPA